MLPLQNTLDTLPNIPPDYYSLTLEHDHRNVEFSPIFQQCQGQAWRQTRLFPGRELLCKQSWMLWSFCMTDIEHSNKNKLMSHNNTPPGGIRHSFQQKKKKWKVNPLEFFTSYLKGKSCWIVTFRTQYLSPNGEMYECICTIRNSHNFSTRA